MIVTCSDVIWYKCMECNVTGYTATDYSLAVFVW